MRIPDPDEIARAEARLADVQSALDEVRQILRAAERVQRTARKGMSAIRPVSIAAAVLAALVIVASVVRRRQGQTHDHA
jgi:hypothetical protein